MLGPERVTERLPELFPIPCARSAAVKGRGSRQRRRRGGGIANRVESCVMALNEIYGNHGWSSPGGVSSSIAQSQVRSFIRRQVGEQLPPADLLLPDEALE